MRQESLGFQTNMHPFTSKSAFTSAAGGAKLVSGRGATVAVPAHDVGSALTLAAAGLTQCTYRAVRVTLACWEILEG